jgi:hypothetical protein
MAKMKKKVNKQLTLYWLGSRVFNNKLHQAEFKEMLGKTKYGYCYLKTIQNETKQKRDRFN